MKLSEAKIWLGTSYVLHPHYPVPPPPWHSNYALVDVRATFQRVRTRMGQPAPIARSFSAEVEKHKERMRLRLVAQSRGG